MISIKYTEKEYRAAAILQDELKGRGISMGGECNMTVTLITDEAMQQESYSVEKIPGGISLRAGSTKGLIYAIGRLLRKAEITDGKLSVSDKVYGFFSPQKQVRGHQLGYRALSNTYDAWDEAQYRRYMLDMMFYGANMVEFIPDQPENELMTDRREMLKNCVQTARELELFTSLWYPNDALPPEESAEKRRSILSDIPSLDVLFIPGSDPGDYPAQELIDRVKTIAHRVHEVSNCRIFVSAQAPHDSPAWGDDFIRAIADCPKEIDGIVMGPNHAMPLPELRRRVPECYPIRMYTDITHNVRCEYPVHYYDDDWHFSCSTINGRESINPRPYEYARLYKEVSPYICGSCCYSEGVNDDFNKMLWTMLDFDENTTVEEIAADYARLFFPGTDTEKLVQGILGLEKNWEGDSLYNAEIDKTCGLFTELLQKDPALTENWRFNCLLFRAECDRISRLRRTEETVQIKKAKICIEQNDLESAKKALVFAPGAEYKQIRADADRLAGLLFSQIGIQLDIGHFHALSWERGAVLESLDLPITDRAYLLKKLNECETAQQAEKYFNRNKANDGEIYYSVALDGIKGLGAEQKDEVYLNFKGDNPNFNDGTLPVCLLNIFDSCSLSAVFSGLEPCDCILKITYSDKPNRKVSHHTVSVNGHVLYDGSGYGGKIDQKFTKTFLTNAFVAVDYFIPAEYIENGKICLSITEPTVGFEVSELRVIRKGASVTF